MLSTIYTAALCGIDGFEVAVECSAHRKLPSLEIIGLADTAVKEKYAFFAFRAAVMRRQRVDLRNSAESRDER